MEQYTNEEFESFMASMKKVSDILRSKKPDYIFAPITGSIPLIDILSIIDRHFPMETVEYPPNSSRFIQREEIMENWLSKFVKHNYSGNKMSIVCIDEVISGSSASKGFQEFANILYNLDVGKNHQYEKKINYEILGIGEMPRSGKRNHSIQSLIQKNKAKVIETKRIITSDNPNLNPLRLKLGEINRQGRQTYLPELGALVYTSDYISLLQNAANYFGVDLDNAHLINVSKIKNSLEKYLI